MLNTSFPGDPSSSKNRRKSRREKPVGDDVVTIYTADDRWVAIIIDQSDGGFGVAVPPSVDVTVGDIVRITAHRKLTKAKVVSREEKPGGIRLGLKAQQDI